MDKKIHFTSDGDGNIFVNGIKAEQGTFDNLNYESEAGTFLGAPYLESYMERKGCIMTLLDGSLTLKFENGKLRSSYARSRQCTDEENKLIMDRMKADNHG